MENKKNIFIVEDDANLLHALSFTLRRHNYIVTETHRAQDALTILMMQGSQHITVDLLITDIQLPDMTGTELVKELSAKNILPSTLVMTAFGTVDLFKELKRLGVKECIDKPFDIQELVGRVSGILTTKN